MMRLEKTRALLTGIGMLSLAAGASGAQAAGPQDEIRIDPGDVRVESVDMAKGGRMAAPRPPGPTGMDFRGPALVTATVAGFLILTSAIWGIPIHLHWRDRD